MFEGAGWVAVAGLILAPLVTWWPVLARRCPRLGLPDYPINIGIDVWSLHVYHLTACCAMAWLVGRTDFWLGVAVAWVALSGFCRGQLIDSSHSLCFAIGALLLVGVRQIPPDWVPLVKTALVGAAAFQIAYCIQQQLGFDLFWSTFLGAKRKTVLQPVGTIGAVISTALFVAIVVPLMPWWMMAAGIWLIWSGHSLGALIAVSVAFMAMSHAGPYAWLIAVMIATLTMFAFSAAGHRLNKDSHYARLAVWGFAFRRWKTSPISMLFGWGLGGWKVRVPMAQDEAKWFPYGETWAQAHNEPYQWVLETGLVGAAILGMWCGAHRGIFADPSVLALGVGSLTAFPFHVVPLALLGIVVVGLAG